MSRKVGNAVARNRVKRRLRAAAVEVLSKSGEPGFDYVLIGRKATLERRYDALVEDLRQAVFRLSGSGRSERARKVKQGKRRCEP